MVLTVHVGNRLTQFDLYQNGTRCAGFRFATDPAKTSDEYVALIRGSMTMQRLQGAILSSVVPPVTDAVARAVEQIAGCPVPRVGPGLKTGLNIKIENPAQLGSDLVAITMGALSRYSAPLVLIQFEVATTLCAVDASGAFLGAVIAPGITKSLAALSASAANLPEIALEAPRNLIGKNTIDSMRAGAVFGTAAMLDGLLSRITAELSAPPTIIATGVPCEPILAHCSHQITWDPDLLADGLVRIWERNQLK